jgi:hypothetical protein
VNCKASERNRPRINFRYYPRICLEVLTKKNTEINQSRQAVSRHRFGMKTSRNGAEVVPKFQVTTSCFSCSPPYVNSSKLSRVLNAVKLLGFQIINKVIRISKLHCLFEASSYYHDVFAFTLFLSERQTGVAWEPSNKVLLFRPSLPKKVPITSPLDFLLASTLHLSFLHVSLSASKG